MRVKRLYKTQEEFIIHIKKLIRAALLKSPPDWVTAEKLAAEFLPPNLYHNHIIREVRKTIKPHMVAHIMS